MMVCWVAWLVVWGARAVVALFVAALWAAMGYRLWSWWILTSSAERADQRAKDRAARAAARAERRALPWRRRLGDFVGASAILLVAWLLGIAVLTGVGMLYTWASGQLTQCPRWHVFGG